ncbi:Carbohydrate sulfotransferase 11 [Amphibalanus amphitrite]|uniref:Carbohydrate sulfotransferase n=2 Tax=Amphibalanus amphitrite TaxID=1232801 RepID=A0A6A4WM49_AMPAM|nr:Carbohydrate sulfotransferase 11 [Amphibalanus amphitrite]
MGAEQTNQVKFDKYFKMADPRLPPLSPSWLAEREAVFEQRSNRIANVCRAYDVRIGRGNVTSRPGVGPVERINGDHFVSVPALNVTACLLAKVASTSLLSTLLRVTGKEVPQLEGNRTSLHAAAGALRLPPSQLGAMLHRSLTVLLVRHPLRRLVAAYRDKIAGRPNWPMLHHFEFLKFGSAPKSQLGRELRDAEMQEHRREALSRDGVPTFGEFLAVALLGDRPLRDAHWAPYWRYCAPCHVRYRMVGQLETAGDDLRYLWHALRLYYWVQIPWLHRSRPEQQPEEGLQSLADTYLRPLERPIMMAFKREYKLDFDLFGYDWAGLMRMSGHCVIGDTGCDLL